MDYFERLQHEFKPPELSPWASFVPGRRGASFKAHPNKGQATTAILYREGGNLYKLVDDKWVLEVLWTVPLCDICKQPRPFSTVQRWDNKTIDHDDRPRKFDRLYCKQAGRPDKGLDRVYVHDYCAYEFHYPGNTNNPYVY